jgi:pimeloyl-ACP methyl ester carboxylesterase
MYTTASYSEHIKMKYEAIKANDGATLAYQVSEPPAVDAISPATCILLLHGFSGSSQYFERNTPGLSQSKHWIVAPDMRGHGKSEHTKHGYHVARLAMDLKEIIEHVIFKHNPAMHIYAVGCSIGAAVLWTYVELFTDHDLAGFVFVDQAPLQDQSLFDNWGPGLHHYGCYNEATTLAAQAAWASPDPKVREETYVGLVDSCLGYRYAPAPSDKIDSAQRQEDEAFFASISSSCDGTWLARLLADHTRYDHREAIGLIEKPILVMAGKRSGCFSIESQKETVRRAVHARFEVFESGHWLFWEEAGEFNRVVLDFVETAGG